MNKPRYFHLVRSLFFPSCTLQWQWEWYACLTVYIKNSVFVGSAGATGGDISCQWIHLILINCKFSLTEKSKPAAVGVFVHYKDSGHDFICTDTIFDASTYWFLHQSPSWT